MVAIATISPNIASPEGEGFAPSPEETLKVTVDMAGEARSMRVTSNEVAAKVACSFGHRSRQRRAFPNQKTDAADRPLESPYWGKATSGGADTPEKGSMKRRHLFDSRNQDVI